MRNLFRLAPAALLLGGFLLLGGIGCGKSEPLFPVSGKVMLKDAPLTAGIVTFVPDDSKGNKSKSSPTGTIGSDGSYTLKTDGRAGAPAGHYKVIVNTETPGMGGPMQVDPNKPALVNPQGGGGVKLDPKYKDSTKTPLAKEVVTSGAAAGHYDLTVAQ